MSRQPRAGGRYIIPIDDTGAAPAEDGGRGMCALQANKTYYYILGGADAAFESITITGYDAAMVITSATVQNTSHAANDVPDSSAVVGEWTSEKPTNGYVGADGTGWSANNSVVAANGTGVGGATFHVGGTGAARTRLEVKVGATGGKVRASGHGKD